MLACKRNPEPLGHDHIWQAKTYLHWKAASLGLHRKEMAAGILQAWRCTSSGWNNSGQPALTIIWRKHCKCLPLLWSSLLRALSRHCTNRAGFDLAVKITPPSSFPWTFSLWKQKGSFSLYTESCCVVPWGQHASMLWMEMAWFLLPPLSSPPIMLQKFQ